MKTIKQSVALALLMTCIPASSLVLAADKQLQSITAQAAGNKTEVQLQFSSPVELPKGFLMENPSRLVFDFPATEVSPNSRSKAVNMGQIQTIDAANNKGKARVVVHLNGLVDHTVESRGNTVVMLFENGRAATTKPNPPQHQQSSVVAKQRLTACHLHPKLKQKNPASSCLRNYPPSRKIVTSPTVAGIASPQSCTHGLRLVYTHPVQPAPAPAPVPARKTSTAQACRSNRRNAQHQRQRPSLPSKPHRRGAIIICPHKLPVTNTATLLQGSGFPP